MTLLALIGAGVVLGLASYVASSRGRTARVVVAAMIGLVVAAIGYTAENARRASVAAQRWERTHCDLVAESRFATMAALAEARGPFDVREAFSADRLSDYLREISFCTHEWQNDRPSACAEALRTKLFAVAHETSRATIAQTLREIAAALKAGKACEQ